MINSDEIKKVYPLRDKKRSNTRATLIKTCNKMIIEKGYKNMTMQAVADEAGIHVQTLYKHFSTKFDLASVAGCQALREIMENRNSDTLNIWEAYVMSNAITISQYNNPGNIQRVNSKGKLIQWEGLAEGGYGSGQRFSKFSTKKIENKIYLEKR